MCWPLLGAFEGFNLDLPLPIDEECLEVAAH